MKRKWIFAVAAAFVALGCVLLRSCTFGNYIARTEIVPGMEWVLVRFGNSEIVWGDKGVVAKGNLALTFCDDGIEVSCGDGRVVYLDVIKDCVISSDCSFVPERKSGYQHGLMIFSAEGIMGPYGRVAYADFTKERTVFMNKTCADR